MTDEKVTPPAWMRELQKLKADLDAARVELAEVQGDLEAQGRAASRAKADADAVANELRVVTEALRGLLREEPNVYEGRLEASLYVSVDELEAAQAALASPSDAARALLERLREETEAHEHFSRLAAQKWRELAAAEADRDRWLGHCRVVLAWVQRQQGYHPNPSEVEAARRDLEQHDAGTLP